MQLGRVSVCVPAYNRPDMVRQLIHSFLRQNYPDKEIVISDDSSHDQVALVVTAFNDPRITYIRNRVNLGFARNLRQAIQLANGEYIIIMGDDDVFLSPGALTQYAEVFDSLPSVGYINCNKAQFGNSLAIENVYRLFPCDTLFAMGGDSMRGIWTTSISIGGIGLRNTFSLDRFYPQADKLYPQVEYVGHVINRAASYGVAATLVGIRAHLDQLGFYAVRGERIKGSERHGTVELFAIYDRLATQYPIAPNPDLVARKMIAFYKTYMLKEVMIVGRARVRKVYEDFCAASPLARKSRKLKVSYWVSQVTPSWGISLLRTLYIFRLRWENHRSFTRLHEALVSMSSGRGDG